MSEAPTAPQPHDEPPRGQRPRLAEPVVLGAVLLAAIGGVVWWATAPGDRGVRRTTGGPQARIDPKYTEYVGDRSCRECHPGEAAAHSRSGHSRTLRPAARTALARQLDGQRVDDPEQPGVSWQFVLEDGQLFDERTEAGKTERRLIEYAFGSGHHATTFVSLLDRDSEHPTCFEHRLTYFSHATGLGLTPGQSLRGTAEGNTPGGRVHSTENTLHCFGCHTTATSNRGPEVLDESTMIANVGCERCHGPGRAHVQAARQGAEDDALAMPFGPGRWTAPQQLKFCGGCHRLPEMVQPGAIRPENPVLVRHQTVGLMQSACYTRSRGALSCVTCHDPHPRASKNQAAYEQACLACHAGNEPSQPSCPVSPQSACIGCHMPQRDVARGMTMADHWIRVHPPRGR